MKLHRENVPFTMVANDVLTSESLSWKAKGLFAYLFSKPDDWDFSADRICRESNEGRKTVLSGIKELEKANLLGRKRQSDGRIEYVLKYSRKDEDPKCPKGTVATDPQCLEGTVPKGHCAPRALISNKENTTNKEVDTNTIYADAIFVEFWSLYPKKEGKGAAWKSWGKLSKTDKPKVIASVKEHVAHHDNWKPDPKTGEPRDNGRFIPNPATFLNQRRFDDDVKKGRTSVGGKYDNL